MNKALFSSILGSQKNQKSSSSELVFSWYIAIQYMFYIIFMIKKIILEGFNDRGGAIVRGRKGKYFEIQK